jgi:hypothetical protein
MEKHTSADARPLHVIFAEAHESADALRDAGDHVAALDIFVDLATLVSPRLSRLCRARVALATAEARGELRRGNARAACTLLESALGDAVIRTESPAVSSASVAA